MDYISKDPEILSYIEKKIINKKMNKIKKNLINIKTSSTLAINETSEKLQKQGKEIFKFGLGQSPFPVPSSLVNELKKRAHEKNYLNVFEVWIKYNLVIQDPDGRTISNWFMPAYGKTPSAFLFSKENAISQATNVALRDAGAKLLLDFYRIPAVNQWVKKRKQNDQKL